MRTTRELIVAEADDGAQPAAAADRVAGPGWIAALYLALLVAGAFALMLLGKTDAPLVERLRDRRDRLRWRRS